MTSRSSSTGRRIGQTVRWVLFAGFALFLLQVIRIANAGEGKRYWSFLTELPYGDKLGHFLLMGTLCLLLNVALGCRRVKLFAGWRVLLGTVIVVILVTGEEFSQIFLPNRSFDLIDLLADMLGIMFASWIVSRFTFGASRKQINGDVSVDAKK